MTLHISLVGRSDLSGEIYRQVRRAIVEGLLKAPDRLPPSRELARTLSIARATVVTAYERLAAEGFIVAIHGSGTFVAGVKGPTFRKVPRKPLHGALQPRALWETIPLATAFDKPAEFDFRTGIPDATLFPHRHWRRLVALELRSRELAPNAVYEKPAGHPELRAAISRHIGLSRGIHVSPDDVIVTNGTQQAVDLLARVLLAPGDQIAVEDPGYETPRRAFESLGARVIGVPVDHEGLVVDAVPPGVKVIYVTPSHQYPLTVTMTLARRRALLAWADRNGAAIIEDDYDGEFRFEGRPLEPMRTIDTSGRVIYVGSFSKTMVPTLRLGFVIAPPSLRLAVQKAKYVSDWHTSTLEQAALARFIKEGGFARHIRRTSAVYRERHSLIAETIIRDFAAHLRLVPSATGLHLAATAPSLSVEEVSQVAARAGGLGIQLHRLSAFATGNKRLAGVVLGYGAISTADVKEGLRRLRTCFG